MLCLQSLQWVSLNLAVEIEWTNFHPRHLSYKDKNFEIEFSSKLLTGLSR